jgi:DNA-binding NtrC family response regulator
MESELFGHEKGAFTGADRTKIGLMELASGGTLFLDEIGEMPFRLQGKLLRALQEREIQRVGGLHVIPVDVRVVAATNRDLSAMAAAGEFRTDLLYRLDVLRVQLPPLRDRHGDIPSLLQGFLQELAERHHKLPLEVDEAAAQALNDWTWPGNVRELINVAERLNALVDDRPVVLADLPAEIRLNAVRTNQSQKSGPYQEPTINPAKQPKRSISHDYREAKERFEREWLEELLRAADGNMAAAARMAGLSRRHMYEKLEKLGIRPPTS